MNYEEYEELLMSEYDDEELEELSETLENDNWRYDMYNNAYDSSATDTIKSYEKHHQLKKSFYGSDLIR